MCLSVLAGPLTGFVQQFVQQYRRRLYFGSFRAFSIACTINK